MPIQLVRNPQEPAHHHHPPPQVPAMLQIMDRLPRLLAAQGFHIAHAFPVQLFNNSPGCPEEHQLPTFGRRSTLGVVIGNTNGLWPRFVQHLAAHHPDALEAEENPLDALVEAAVTQAVQQCLSELPACRQADPPASHHSQPLTPDNGPPQPVCSSSRGSSMQHHPTNTPAPFTTSRFAIRFSHHTEPGQFVNMMRAAQLSGLAYYSSTTHLCMHPEYGPWFALRAVAVFDVDGPDPAAFHQLPCPHPDLESEAADKMKALEALGGFSNWQQHWRDWAALRALGAKYTDQKHAYSADQLEYHYTKNKDVLRRAVAAWQQQQQPEAHTLLTDLQGHEWRVRGQPAAAVVPAWQFVPHAGRLAKPS